MKRELKETLNGERDRYIPHIKTLKNKIMALYTHNEEYEIYRFICALRKAEFYKPTSKLLYTYYLRKSNIRGNRLGYFIAPGVLGKGVRLYHRGGIIINSQARIGEGCLFHGDNCVGNNGVDNRCPVLGKQVELGIGAKVVGDVFLADGIRVGAKCCGHPILHTAGDHNCRCARCQSEIIPVLQARSVLEMILGYLPTAGKSGRGALSFCRVWCREG